MSRFFDDFFTRDLDNWNNGNFSSTNTTLPAVNIVENADSYSVEMAAPGMKKDDFDIELKDNVLTIRSERRNEQETKEENERYMRREFSYQSFQRSFQLNQQVVDQEKIKASYENGVLRLVLPKREEAKTRPARRIQVG
jgi:HSP20 family protein